MTTTNVNLSKSSNRRFENGKLQRHANAGWFDEETRCARNVGKFKIYVDHFDCNLPYSNYYVADTETGEVYEQLDYVTYISGGLLSSLVEYVEQYGVGEAPEPQADPDTFDPLARVDEAEEADDDDEWEAEQAAQIKAELEHEIATMKERIERKERVGYFEGKRGRAMRRHYERKLANAKALHAELFGDGGAEDEIAQAAQVVKDAGGVAVLPENRERFDAQLKELHNAEGACDKALARLNKLTGAIEDMKLDCDAEVYDVLLEIADILGR